MYKVVAVSAVFASSILAASPHWFEPNLGQTNAGYRVSRAFHLSRRFEGSDSIQPPNSCDDAFRRKPQLPEAKRSINSAASVTGTSETIQLNGAPQSPTIARVRFIAMSIPGIDQVFYYNALGQLEFDFHRRPGRRSARHPTLLQLPGENRFRRQSSDCECTPRAPEGLSGRARDRLQVHRS